MAVNKNEFNRKDMETIARSPEARQLLEMLKKGSGSGLSQAAEAVKKGEYAKAASILKPLLEMPDTAMLMEELNRKLGRN